MPKKPRTSDSQTPDNSEPIKQHARIDADPPYAATPPRAIHNFQKLLAELIARRLIADNDGSSGTQTRNNE
jgi:hypothetical protein